MNMRHARAAWLRMQESPLELAIGGLAFAAAINGIVTEWATLPMMYVAVYAALGLGGLGIVVGRFRDALHVESAGLALMIGALAFVTLRNLSYANSGGDISSILLNTGALLLGLGIRLWVVRKAVKAREKAAQIQGQPRG